MHKINYDHKQKKKNYICPSVIEKYYGKNRSILGDQKILGKSNF